MNDTVLVELPVTAEVADMLRDHDRAGIVGRLLSDMLRPSATGEDPLVGLLAALKEEVRASGLTDADVDAELAAYNAEHRL